MAEEALSVPGAMWHVTITVNGPPVSSAQLQESLSSLATAHPFGLSARYANDVAELRYWEEGHDCEAVVASALRLWRSVKTDTKLPDWPVVGVEVVDRATFRRRWPAGSDASDLLAPGVKPLPPVARD